MSPTPGQVRVGSGGWLSVVPCRLRGRWPSDASEMPTASSVHGTAWLARHRQQFREGPVNGRAVPRKEIPAVLTGAWKDLHAFHLPGPSVSRCPDSQQPTMNHGTASELTLDKQILQDVLAKKD